MATANLDLEKIEMTDSIQTSLLQKMNGNFDKIDTAYKRLKDLLIARTGKPTLAEAIEYVDKLVNAQDGTITPDKVVNGYVGYKQLEKVVGSAFADETSGEGFQLIEGNQLYTNDGQLIIGTMKDKSNTGTAASGSVSGDEYRLIIPQDGFYNSSSYLTRSKSNILSDFGITAMPKITVTCNASTSYVSNYGAGINNNGVLVIWVMTASTSYEHVYFYPKTIGIGSTGLGWNINSWDTGDPVGCSACTVSGLSSYSNIFVDLAYNTVNSSYDYVRLDVTITA